MALGLEKRLERRAQILRATRKSLAQHGFDNLTMRGLAKECGVTVATLYNLFAGKEDLVSAAVEDLFRLQVGSIQRDPSCRGLMRILKVAQVVADTMESDPEYMRAVIALNRTSPVVSTMTGGFLELYLAGVEEMRAAGDIAAWTPSSGVAHAIAAHFRGTNQEWVNGLLTVGEVRRRKNLGVSLLLAGVAEGEMAARLREGIRALRQPDAVSPAAT